MRRVAITGIGAVSPNGIGREQFWEATRNGVSGVRRITRFDTTGYQVQVAGEIPDEFDEKQYVEVKDRPHVSRAVPLAAAAVKEAEKNKMVARYAYWVDVVNTKLHLERATRPLREHSRSVGCVRRRSAGEAQAERRAPARFGRHRGS